MICKSPGSARQNTKKDPMKSPFRRRCVAATALVAACVLLLAAIDARADEIHVVTSGGFTAAYLELVSQYESTTHNRLITEFGPSMGTTHNAIPVRLDRGEAIDVVILAVPALEELIKQGKVRADSRVDLVQSKIGMAVKAGAPHPDISTVDALKRTLLAAKSIAYSDSASGVYLSTELFPKLGIADQIKGKSKKIEADPVGGVVATGEFEIGFQQISELRPVKGIDIVGELPPGAQKITVFSAGIPTTATHVDAAKALIQWLASPAAYAAIRKSGLEPANAK
jgi:molybdate transport system substrate-binding protein